VAPGDVEMDLQPGEHLTRSLARLGAYAGARASFGWAEKDVLVMTGQRISRAEIARIVEDHGRRFDARQRAREAERLRPVSPERPAPKPWIRPKRLVLQADATSVLTVKGEEHKMVYCGRAFGMEMRGKKDGSNRPFLTDSRFTASAESFEDFGQRFKALGYESGLRTAEQVAFIADGARPLWAWAQANLPRGTVMIQDFWHVVDRLSKLGEKLWGSAKNPILKRWRKWLRASHVDRVIKELQALRASKRGATRAEIEVEIGYLETGRGRMDYARYAREGWPIGSGAIEGTCKHLVKERFDVTGARWRRKNIPYVLALRLAIFNKQWDREWESVIAA
jgi:hypothetical protein